MMSLERNLMRGVFTAYMGKMGISAFTDLAAATLYHGLSPRQLGSMAEALNLFREVPLRRHLEGLYVATSDMMHSIRSMELGDITDASGSPNPFGNSTSGKLMYKGDAVMDWMARKTASLSLLNRWNTNVKRWMAHLVMNEVIHGAKKMAKAAEYVKQGMPEAEAVHRAGLAMEDATRPNRLGFNGERSKRLVDILEKHGVDWEGNQPWKSTQAPEKPSPIARFVEFAKKALADKSNQAKEPIRVVSQAEASAIKDATGLNVEGYSHVLDSDEIRHTFKKHGNQTSEAKRGQVAVTPDDFGLVQHIIDNPDKIALSPEKTSNGLKAIVYEKKLGDTTYVVEEVRTGSKTLAVKTMYKRPGSTNDVSAPGHNVLNGAGPASTVASGFQNFKGFVSPELGKWWNLDRDLYETFTNAVNGEVMNLIPEPKLMSRPLMNNHWLGRLVNQFQSFAYSWGIRSSRQPNRPARL